MRQVLWLAEKEAKCIGSACRYPKPCARRDIPHSKGRPLADYSLPLQYIPECGPSTGWAKFISYEKAVKPVDKPVVKEWLGDRA